MEYEIYTIDWDKNNNVIKDMKSLTFLYRKDPTVAFNEVEAIKNFHGSCQLPLSNSNFVNGMSLWGVDCDVGSFKCDRFIVAVECSEKHHRAHIVKKIAEYYRSQEEKEYAVIESKTGRNVGYIKLKEMFEEVEYDLSDDSLWNSIGKEIHLKVLNLFRNKYSQFHFPIRSRIYVQLTKLYVGNDSLEIQKRVMSGAQPDYIISHIPVDRSKTKSFTLASNKEIDPVTLKLMSSSILNTHGKENCPKCGGFGEQIRTALICKNCKHLIGGW